MKLLLLVLCWGRAEPAAGKDEVLLTIVSPTALPCRDCLCPLVL